MHSFQKRISDELLTNNALRVTFPATLSVSKNNLYFSCKKKKKKAIICNGKRADCFGLQDKYIKKCIGGTKYASFVLCD
jgi:hypothetical protein